MIGEQQPREHILENPPITRERLLRDAKDLLGDDELDDVLRQSPGGRKIESQDIWFHAIQIIAENCMRIGLLDAVKEREMANRVEAARKRAEAHRADRLPGKPDVSEATAVLNEITLLLEPTQ